MKPENILIFEDEDGAPHVRVTDFGHSAFGENDKEKCYPPSSGFWTAPEHHHLGFSIVDAKIMDVYTLALIGLWLLMGDSCGVKTGTEAKVILSHEIDSNTLTENALEVVSTLEIDGVGAQCLSNVFKSALVADAGRRTPSVRQMLMNLEPAM